MTYSYDIFISYGSPNGKAVVDPLRRALEAAGFVLWLDEKSIHWGEDIRASIRSGLTDSRYVLIILSDDCIGRVWPTLELGNVFFENEERLLVLIVGDDKVVLDAYKMLAHCKYSKWNGDPEPVVAEVRSLDDKYFGTEWIHHHPSNYTGQVWIAVLPSLRHLHTPHKFTVAWGPWRFPGQITFSSVEAVYYTHWKRRAGESFAVVVNIDPPAHIEFGIEIPPEPEGY